MTREEAIAIIRKEYLCVDRDCDIERNCGKCDLMMPSKEPILKAYKMAIQALEQEQWTPVSEKYEHHIDHTDCIWYGSDSGCPVTCSQYRDGWNDAMDYIFKNGKGYQPYRHDG
jgi:hypothetical protein